MKGQCFLCSFNPQMPMDYMALAYISDASLGGEQDQDVMMKTLDLHWNVPCKQQIRTHEVAFGLNFRKACRSTKNPNHKCSNENVPLFFSKCNLMLNLT